MAIGTARGLSPDLALPHEVEDWMAARRYGTDVVTSALTERFHATLGRPVALVASGDPAPLGLHWCLAPEATAADHLGSDGLPSNGGIIPSVRRLTVRMWGGGEVRFLCPLQVDDRVERVSRLIDITEKTGRSGRLAFARIRHDYQARGMTCVSEVQTIAFRDPLAAPPAESPVCGGAEAWDFNRSITTTTPMLFQFSALTFNSHRIHYDQAYAMTVERHPGLVVHGPLSAALLLDALCEHVGAVVIASIRVKAERPAYCGMRLTLAGRIRGAEAVLAALDASGRAIMRGSATLVT